MFRIILLLIISLFSMFLYGLTLAPSVSLIDSGELIVAATHLGVPHPAGMPLWVLLTHLFTLLPFASQAVAVHWSSAAYAACGSVCVYLLVELILQVYEKKKESYLLVPAVTALLFSCSRTVWHYATVAEVYTLNIFLFSAMLALFLGWRKRVIFQEAGESTWFLGAALVLGLSLGVHNLTLGLAIPALSVLILGSRGKDLFRRKYLYAGVLISVCMFILVNLSMMWMARQDPPFNYGDPSTLERLWWHMTARQFQVFLHFSWDVVVRQTGYFFTCVAREFGVIVLPLVYLLSFFGIGRLWSRDRILASFLITLIVVNLAYCLNYEIGEDKDAYYLPVFLAILISSALGLHELFGIVKARIADLPISRGVTALICGCLLLIPLLSSYVENDHSRDYVAEDYAANVLDAMDEGGLLLTQDWQIYSPLLYVRHVEKRRLDTAALDLQLLRRTWYLRYLRKTYPDLASRVSSELEIYEKELDHWEHDSKAYENDTELNRRINTSYEDFIAALADRNNGAVYLSSDVAINRDPNMVEVSKRLLNGREMIPQGLIFERKPKHAGYIELKPLKLRTRGLNDGSLKWVEDDVVPLKVLPVYLSMLANRGRYLALYGKHEEAIRAYEEALRLEPRYIFAQKSMELSEKAMKTK